MAAMIRRFYEANVNNQETVTCWGDGTPRREFLYSDDLATACVLSMQEYDDYEIMNVSTGEEVSIKETAETVAKIVGYDGTIEWDTTKPNGTIKRPLHIEKIKQLDWKPQVSLEDGIRKSIEDFGRNWQ
jgi:GDP-L-fucose synthase